MNELVEIVQKFNIYIYSMCAAYSIYIAANIWCIPLSRMSHNRIKMTDHTTNITTLPSELLIVIFEYCSAFDLVRLTQVCKRFHMIIERDLLWSKKGYLPLATNQRSKRFLERSVFNLYLNDKSLRNRFSCVPSVVFIISTKQHTKK